MEEGRPTVAHCLVTGGQGFIGSALVRKLLADGHQVVALDLPEPPFEGLQVLGISDEVEWVEGDVADVAVAERAVADAEWVFHLGAVTIVGQAARDPLGTYRSNAQGTWTLLEACRRSSPTAVVVASSDKAYGPSPNLPYREQDDLRPVAPYEGSKAACDLIARSYAESWDLPVAVTRLANVYGGGDLNFSRLVPELMAAAVGGREPGIRSDGSPRRDFLHVSDAVSGYLAVAGHVTSGQGHGEAFNVGTGRPVAVSEVIESASGVAGVPLVSTPVGEGETDGEIDDQYVDPAKVGSATGWAARVSLRDGLEEAFEWYSGRPALCP